jgi:hypothetical protein
VCPQPSIRDGEKNKKEGILEDIMVFLIYPVGPGGGDARRFLPLGGPRGRFGAAIFSPFLNHSLL